MKIIVVVLFMFVLCADFIIELMRKKVNYIDVLIRAFMIIAATYIVSVK